MGIDLIAKPLQSVHQKLIPLLLSKAKIHLVMIQIFPQVHTKQNTDMQLSTVDRSSRTN